MKDGKGESAKRRDPSKDAMPLELQLDLLVDEELAEDRRQALLLSLDRDGGTAWRDLSMRFLERQVERRSVRDLIAGGRLVPVEEEAIVYKIPRTSWFHGQGLVAVAAGLVIAIGSALVAGYWVEQHRPAVAKPVEVEVVKANLPGAVMGTSEAVPVEYKVVSDRDPPFFPTENGNMSPRRTLLIQPDGPHKAMVIPVNTLPMNIY